MDDTFAMIASERRQLADEMTGWTDEQWRTPSLCGQWTVRDVAAHLVTPFVVSTPRFAVGLVTSGFSFDRASDRLARAEAEKPIADIIDALRRNADNRFTPPGAGPGAPLTDVIVHGQDMRRPLGLAHCFESTLLVRALDFVKDGAFGFVPRRRLAGLHFVAGDVEWSAGAPDGAAVTGPAEALLLAITGRTVALADLDGPGVDLLRQRLG
jgi:uncharacterized protein (TIGR03083 family)